MRLLYALVPVSAVAAMSCAASVMPVDANPTTTSDVALADAIDAPTVDASDRVEVDANRSCLLFDPPFCSSASGCAAGAVCIRGACWIQCDPSGALSQCENMKHEAYCTELEGQYICAPPMSVVRCDRDGDCPTGHLCIDGACC